MVSASQVQEICITRQFDAPASIVYQAFTERDRLTQWLADDGHTRTQVGGHLLVYWFPEGHAYGTFLELEENTKAVFTWQSVTDSKATLVTVTITESDGQTALTLTHSQFDDETHRAVYEQQWVNRLDNLATVLHTGKDPRITGRIIIGIIPESISDEQAETVGLEPGSYNLIGSLVAGYSAEAAGLKKGDVLISIAGEKISNNNGIFQIIMAQGLKVGDVTQVAYYRDGTLDTVDIELKGYPLPDLPDNYQLLAQQITQRYDQYKARLDDLLRSASDMETSQRPGENEWNAKEVLAHLLLTERWQQSWIGSFMQGQRITGFTGNAEARIHSISAVYPNKQAIIAAFKLSLDETVALIDAIPETYLADKSMLWQIGFNVFQNYWHIEVHFDQIQNAIALTKV